MQNKQKVHVSRSAALCLLQPLKAVLNVVLSALGGFNERLQRLWAESNMRFHVSGGISDVVTQDRCRLFSDFTSEPQVVFSQSLIPVTRLQFRISSGLSGSLQVLESPQGKFVKVSCFFSFPCRLIPPLSDLSNCHEVAD